jgi:hypothetical protein
MESSREWLKMDAEELRNLAATLTARLTEREAELSELFLGTPVIQHGLEEHCPCAFSVL